MSPLTEQAGGDWLFYKVVLQDVCLVASDGVEEIMVSVLCEGGEVREVRWQVGPGGHASAGDAGRMLRRSRF